VAHEALSASLDGERQHVPAARVDAHVESCSGCREWLAEAAALRRLTRQAGLNTGPDLSPRIVAAADALGRARFGRFSWLVSRLVRCGLAGAGVAMVALAAPCTRSRRRYRPARSLSRSFPCTSPLSVSGTLVKEGIQGMIRVVLRRPRCGTITTRPYTPYRYRVNQLSPTTIGSELC
jgi:hypothetical protein